MSKIEKLEKTLYENEPDPELEKRMRHRIHFPGRLHMPPHQWGSDAAEGEQKEPMIRRDTIFKIIGSVVLILVIFFGALGLFIYLGRGGTEARIVIQGRSPIESGEAVTIPITVKNVSRVALREIEASVVFPEGTTLIEGGSEGPVPTRFVKKFDDLGPSEEKTFTVETRMFGKEEEEKKVDVVLLYRPENLRARFSAKESAVFVIGKVPLAISWKIPDVISQGQEVSFDVHYSSSAKVPFQNLSLRMVYPPGFLFTSAEPKPDVSNNQWKIGDVLPGGEGLIQIKGIVSGEEGEIKAFTGGIGVYNEFTREWRAYSDSVRESKFAVAPLSVKGFLDQDQSKIVNPGDTLVFSVEYRNNTQFVIKNVSVKAGLDEIPFSDKDRILDLSSLSIDKGGVFDAQSRFIIWGPSNIPVLKELKPGDSGTVTFRLKTKEKPAIRAGEDKEIVIRLHTVIQAAGIPQELSGTKLTYEDVLDLKVRSRVLFAARSTYRSSSIKNVGPLPPKIGSKTTYTIVWEVRNFTNTLNSVDVRGTLPPNVKWEGNIFPSDVAISYDAATGEVRWKIGEVFPGVGVLSPALMGAFQVSIVPAESDFGKSVLLVNESKISAHDTFIDEVFEDKADKLSTELRDDSLTSTSDWKVVR